MLISDFTNDHDRRDIATLLTCLDCQGSYPKLQSRGLCQTCYKRHQRAGDLADYPTTDFWVNHTDHIRWAVEHYREEVLEALGIADADDAC